MKILLFGATGQVGWELQRSLAPLGELAALDRSSANYCGDLSNLEGVVSAIKSYAPDVVVNAAAYTAVDLAESNQEIARKINAEAPTVMAAACAAIGALLVHYSTDYVFDGSGSRPWSEDDAVSPLNTYGSTKLEGEQGIRRESKKHLIFRTSWVYAVKGGNFAKTMMRLAAEKESLQVIDDQHGAPTSAELLADVTAHAIRMALAESNLYGTYHVAASGFTTWFDYARFVVRHVEEKNQPLKVRSEEIQAVRSDAFKTAARRPANSRLNTDKFRTTFSLVLPAWESGVKRMIDETLSSK